MYLPFGFPHYYCKENLNFKLYKHSSHLAFLKYCFIVNPFTLNQLRNVVFSVNVPFTEQFQRNTIHFHLQIILVRLTGFSFLTLTKESPFFTE